MHPFDAIVGIVLAIGVIRGYSTGLFKQIGAIVGFVLAFAFAAGLLRFAADFLAGQGWVSVEMAPVLGFLAVFIIVYGLVMIVAKFVEEALDTLKLGFVSRVAGAGFGGLKAALLVSLALIILAYAGVPSQDTRKNARLYAPVSMLAPTVWSWVSSNSETFDELTRRLEIEIDRRLEPDSPAPDLPAAPEGPGSPLPPDGPGSTAPPI